MAKIVCWSGAAEKNFFLRAGKGVQAFPGQSDALSSRCECDYFCEGLSWSRAILTNCCNFNCFIPKPCPGETLAPLGYFLCRAVQRTE